MLNVFCGEYQYQIDEKNRLRLPPQLKELLGSSAVIIQGNNGNLYIHTEEVANKMKEKISAIPITDVEAQKAVAQFYSSMYTIKEDTQGRFILPANLKKFAGIEKEVVYVGAGDRVEIWSAERLANNRPTMSIYDCFAKYSL